MLQDTSTGARVATCVQRVTATRELRHITGRAKWQFDWKQMIREGCEVYCLRTLHDHQPQGLIALRIDRENCYVEVDLLEKAPHNFGDAGKYGRVGRHLLAIAARISVAHGFEGYLGLVSKNKARLKNFYEQLGFIQVGRSQRLVLNGSRSDRLVRDYRSRRC